MSSEFKLVTEAALLAMSPAEFSAYMEQAAQMKVGCYTCGKLIMAHSLAVIDETGKCTACCSSECHDKALEARGLGPGKLLVDMTAGELADVQRRWADARARAKRWANVGKA